MCAMKGKEDPATEGAEAKDKEATKKEVYNRKGSVRSTRSTTSEGVYVKRVGSTPSTSGVFKRQSSSGKSLTSIRTRLTSVRKADYHDDLKPSIEGALNVNLVFTTFIIVFGSSFQFGYNIGVLNQPKQLIVDFYKDVYTQRFNSTITEETVTVLWSLTTALFIPGGLIGAFLGGWLADKIGRKKTLLFSHVFAFIGAGLSCACVAADTPELLMLGRFLVGINSGLGNCLAPIFLSEMSPCNLRGALGTVHQLFITLGIFFSSVFGLESILGTAEQWPYLILLEVIPAATSLCILPFLPETPRYLLLIKGQRDAAQASMSFYRRTDDVSADMEEMDTEHQNESSDSKESFTVKELLTQRGLVLPLLIACALQVVQQFSGINAIFFYSSGVFKNANVDDAQIPYAVIGTNGVNVVMTIVSVMVMDLAGRRPLLLYPMIVMVLDLILITVSLNLESQYSWMSYISIGAVIIYVICFAVGLGPIPMMIATELFRQGPRPLAMAGAGLTNWLATFVIAMAFEPIQEKCGDYTFVIFLILMVGFTVFVYFLVPETKNKTFEEIAHQFSPGGDLEVEEMVEDDDVFDALPNDDGDHEDHQLVTLNLDRKDSVDA